MPTLIPAVPRRLPIVALSLATLITVASPREADAFCGFYVAGADAQLYNDATMVVLMRDGTRLTSSRVFSDRLTALFA